jgi:hypothetical protein
MRDLPIDQEGVQKLSPGEDSVICEGCGRLLVVVRGQIALTPCFFEKGSESFHIAGGLLFVNTLVDVETWRTGDVDYIPDRHRLHAERCEQYRRIWQG